VPELPEVETIRRISADHLVGHCVRAVEITLPKLLRQSVIKTPAQLVGRTLISAGRRGKVLNLEFSEGVNLLIHFKLAGQWAVILPDGDRFVAGHPVPAPDGAFPHKSTHASMQFDDGRMVWYTDIRQFGWFNLLPADDVDEALAALALGPEATGPIDERRMSSLFARRTVPVKAVLLDQKVLAGLDNIYADEALHAARIYPGRSANSLSAAEIASLIEAIPPVLEEGIRQGGVRIVHSKAFPDNGIPAVHGREGERCTRCGTGIVKIRVAGRGTYFCPNCQPMP